MDTLNKTLTSRTVWTVVVMVLVAGLPAIKDQIPATIQPLVDAVLGVLAVYFKLNPSQAY